MSAEPAPHPTWSGTTAVTPAPSLLRLGAVARVSVALGLVAGLWLVVVWALG